jgi:hypothetical protein
MTQDEILDALEDQREKFLEAIDGLNEDQLTEPGVVGEWSVKDIMFHLTMWEAELVKLLWQAAQGAQPTTVHFGKTPVDELNAAWSALSRTRSLDQVIDDFAGVRKQTSRRVSAFKDQDLKDAQRFPWLKGHPLWEWIAEDSFKHEAEHTAQILAWRKAKGV